MGAKLRLPESLPRSQWFRRETLRDVMHNLTSPRIPGTKIRILSNPQTLPTTARPALRTRTFIPSASHPSSHRVPAPRSCRTTIGGHVILESTCCTRRRSILIASPRQPRQRARPPAIKGIGGTGLLHLAIRQRIRQCKARHRDPDYLHRGESRECRKIRAVGGSELDPSLYN